MTANTTKNAVIFVRVSSEKQLLQRQIEALKAKVNEFGWHIAREPFKEKISGRKKNTDRPVLNEMLEYCCDKSNAISYVILDEISRLGRNEEVITNVKRLFAAGVNVYFSKERLFTINDDGSINENAQIFLYIVTGMNEQELRTTKHRQVEGKLTQARAGGVNQGKFDPYGYGRSNDEKHKKLVKDPEQAALVEEIFDMYLRGNRGTQAIATYLNAKGIPSMRGAWSSATIRNMLRQTIYIGKRKYQGKLLAEPELIDLPHLRIISDEDFAAADVKLRDGSYKLDIGKKYNYLLDGKLIRCGICGNFYYAVCNPSNDTKVYKCNSTRHNGNIKACGNYGINIDKLDKAVMANMQKYFPAQVREQLDYQYFEQQIEIKKNQIVDLELEQETLKTQIRNIEILFEKAKMSIVQYEQKTNAVELQLTQNQLRVTRLQADVTSLEFQMNEPQYSEVTKEVLHKVVQSIVIHPTMADNGRKNEKAVIVTMTIRGREFKFTLSYFSDKMEILSSTDIRFPVTERLIKNLEKVIADRAI